MSALRTSALRTPASPDLLIEDLNAAQREAVLAAEGPVAILAAAGTGKTRVVTRRTAYAIATGLVPADQAPAVLRRTARIPGQRTRAELTALAEPALPPHTGR